MDKSAEAKKAVKEAHNKFAEAIVNKNKELNKKAFDETTLNNIKSIGGGTLAGGGTGAALSALSDYLSGNNINTRSLINSALLGALAGGGLTAGYKALTNGIIPSENTDSWPVAFGNTMVSSMMKYPLTYTGAATGAYGSYRLAAKPIIRESDILERLTNSTQYKSYEDLMRASAKAADEAALTERLYKELDKRLISKGMAKANVPNNIIDDIMKYFGVTDRTVAADMVSNPTENIVQHLRQMKGSSSSSAEKLLKMVDKYKIYSKPWRIARMGGAMAFPAATIGLGYLLDKILFSRD